MKEQILKVLEEGKTYGYNNNAIANELLNLFSVSHRFTSGDIETLKEHRDFMNDVIAGDYKPDSFTNQPLDSLINRIENGG